MSDIADTTEDANRLPGDVVPVRYDLRLEPDLGDASFAGEVTIEVEVRRPTRRVVLNAADLAVSEAFVELDGARQAAAAIATDDELERLTIDVGTELPAGPARLLLRFRGELNDKLKGFYRSTFVDTDGNEQTIATTQFEATDARRAFPCWDEPELKAVFGITLVVDESLTAISNAREVERTATADGRVAIRFADTMKMSTYLVAFIVGALDATEPVDVRGTPLRVVYPRGKAHLTRYALEVGAFCLEFFADYYDIPYPGDKLDLVAVPDFAFGAMENLGCVTFREVLLLVEPSEVTQPELQNVTDVIAHELAHMWFGDLVTMKWWNGIWLNEAFATFMEMLATDAFRPEWDRWVTFGLSRTAALDVDALTSTRPIEYPVTSPQDAEGMFDILTYEKGAAVVRMLEQYLEPDRFREGIRLYLSRHQYGNTETTDLWDAIEEATGDPVRRIMDSWIFQGGFPLLEVDLSFDTVDVNSPGRLWVKQRRFSYAGDLGEGDERENALLDAEQWIVPIIFSLKEKGTLTFERLLLEPSDDALEVLMIEPVDFLLLNTEGTGFYRVAYSKELLDALVAHLFTDLSAIERYGLVDDMWALVLAGLKSTTDFLDFVAHFGAETDLSVWQRIISALHALDRLVDDAPRARLQELVRELVGPALEQLGEQPIEGERDRDRELRGVLFEALGALGRHTPAMDRARQLYAAAKQGEHVEPSLHAAAISVIAATGDSDEFDEFVTRFRTAETPQEELRYLSALADFDASLLVDRALNMTLTGEVRTQNAPYLIRRALTNRNHGDDAWRFVVQNWEAMNDKFPSNSIARMLEGVRALSSPETAPDVFAFFEDHEVPQGDKILAQHLERLEVNVALRARESQRLADHLS